MKINNIKNFILIGALGVSMASCEDFLDRPAEDNYNTDNFYQNDEQCYQGVNYLYNSPWYDFQRGFINVGETMSGNEYQSQNAYANFSVNGTDEALINMSYSLWAVIGHANTVYNSLKGASGTASEAVKNACMGECLTWKAMAYFYLVRSFGDVPIIHDNSDVLGSGNYNSVFKVQKADVYEYIIMTLEKALELLPKSSTQKGRIDYYCAEGLLAKVYLTRSGLGMSGSRNEADLAEAAKLAKDVIDNSGRNLMKNYSDIFRMQNNECEESLIAWRWTVNGDNWTRQNTLQSDLAFQGFDEHGDCWGGWRGPSVDLQDAFGVSSLDDPSQRNDIDTRRKATMMLPGDVYEYFWTDKGGFDLLKFVYDPDYGKGGPGGTWQCGTGAQHVKHLYGDNYDHTQALGVGSDRMANGLATHILRLADVYLIYAEAALGNSASTSDANILAAFNAVRTRAHATAKTSITFDDIWKERRLELAMEGDRWYDYVRRSYYDVQACIDELKAQRRSSYLAFDDVAKNYFESGQWVVDPSTTKYDDALPVPNVTPASFTLPFPTEDVVFNPNLLEEPIHEDVRERYSY